MYGMAALLFKFCKFWFTADFFAVGIFAFAGVGIRSAIHYPLSGHIEPEATVNYGPFMQMFYAQTYLASNILGCFIMSFCIANTARISKTSVPLYKGLTTGMCGSITTLSSWMNGSVNMLFDKNWYKILIMIVLEFWLTWAAFTMGYAFAKVVDNMVASCLRYISKKQHVDGDIDAGAVESKDAALSAERPASEHTPVLLNDDEDIHISSKELGALNTARTDQLDALEAMDNVNETEVPSGAGPINAEEDKLDAQSEVDLERDIHPRVDNPPADSRYKPMEVEQAKQSPSCKGPKSLFATVQRNEYYIWAALLISVATVLWIVLILEPKFSYFDDIKVRNTYRSVALGPLGAWTRWGLTRFPKIKALWPNMHPQTLIANLTAVTFMCLLSVFGTTSWVPAINAGTLLCVYMIYLSTYLIS